MSDETVKNAFRAPRDRTVIVALAAALWGLDGLLREPLTETIAPATLVFWEHLIVVVVLSPLIPRALRAFRRAPMRDRLAVVVIGVGASAVATVLFTKAFAITAAQHDFITPLVLQKLQPVIAVALAMVLLHERLRTRFAYYAVPALIGAWLLSFRNPFDVTVSSLTAALLSIGAAALWAGGTVLGRLVSRSYTPIEVTTLRYVFGLPAAFLIVVITGVPFSLAAGNILSVSLLALIPGLAALCLYYYALQTTAASRATFAELAFPVTAALVGVLFLGSKLGASQWVGLVLIAGAVTALGWNERRRPAVVDPIAELPLASGSRI